MSGEYYKTNESVEQYIKLAQGDNGAELIDKLKPFLPSEKRLLEIGSGPGSDWEILNQDYMVTGSDNSVQFLDRLVKKYPSGEFLELDATTLDTDQKFEGIYSNKVMHHLKDDQILTSIHRQHKILDSDGVISHSFWKGEGSEVFKGLFVNYYTMDSLKTLFEPLFDILLLEYYNEFENDDSILLIGKKK
jgi:cyclopropane fatty-acyl-phospholipid synthase-like methyltransferase